MKRTVAAVWEVSFSKLEVDSPASAALLKLCAFFAPDNIPLDAIHDGAAALQEPLKGAVARPVAFNAAVRMLLRYSLARRDGDALSVHRLVQAMTRDGLDPATAQAHAEAAVRLVNAALPRPPWEHTNWPAIGALLPHALATAEAAERFEAGLETAATVLNETALYHSARAAYAEAEPLYERALAIGEKTLGPEHPDLATWLNNLALLYQDTGRYSEAEPLYERALAIGEKTLPPDHPHRIRIRENHAGLLDQLGRPAEAAELRAQTPAIR